MTDEPLAKWVSILYRYSMIYANSFLKDYGMSGGQLPFFMNIVNNPGITQEELSKLLKIDKSTTTRAVKSLCSSGYVLRKSDESDKRVYRLYPTQKAKRVERVVLEKAKMWDAVLLKGFKENERKSARRLLRLMVENALKYLDNEGESR